MTSRGDDFGGSIFFMVKNPPYLENSEIVLNEGFGGFRKV